MPAHSARIGLERLLAWPVERCRALAQASWRIRWIRGAVFAAAIALGDLVIALGLVDARFHKLLLLGGAVAALALIFRSPFAAACAVLVLVASIIEPGRFKVHAGPIDWRLEELIVGALFVVAVVRPRRAWWGGLAGGALAGFFIVLGFAGLMGMQTGRVGFSDAFAYARLFAPLLLFFVIVRLFPERQQIQRLLLFAVVVAAFTGIVALAVAAPGSPLAHILNPGDTASIRDNEGLGLVNRVRLPGVSLAYVLFWYAAVHLMAGRRGSRSIAWLAAVGAMGLDLALSFNRNMWLGLVIGLLILLVTGRSMSRRRLTAALAVLAAGVVAIALAGPKLSSGSPLYPIIERGTTLLHPAQESRDPSLNDRRLETELAIGTIKRHPVTGVGPGAPYGADWLWVHNQYLHLLLIGGPAALLLFLVFVAAPPITVLSRRSADEEIVALAIGILITMVSAIVMISFVNATWAGVLALLGGALTVLGPGGAGSVNASPDDKGQAVLGTAAPSSPRPPAPSRTAPARAPVAAAASRTTISASADRRDAARGPWVGGQDAADVLRTPLRGLRPLDEEIVRQRRDQPTAQ